MKEGWHFLSINGHDALGIEQEDAVRLLSTNVSGEVREAVSKARERSRSPRRERQQRLIESFAETSPLRNLLVSEDFDSADKFDMHSFPQTHCQPQVMLALLRYISSEAEIPQWLILATIEASIFLEATPALQKRLFGLIQSDSHFDKLIKVCI